MRGVATAIDEAPGLHRPPPGRVLHEVPRPRARRAGPTGSTGLVRIVLTPADPAALPLPRDRRRQRALRTGPVILAPNHFSFWDHFFVAVLLRREVHFMAKSQLFKPPVIDFIINHGGVFPVRRGPARRGGLHHRPHDPRPRRHGADVRRGRALAQRASWASPSPASGGWRWRPACRSCRSRSTARSTCARRSALRFPKVTVQYGEPIALRAGRAPDREQSQEVAEQVFDRVRRRCTRRSRRRAAAACSLAAPRPARASAGREARTSSRRLTRSARYAFFRTCQCTVISRDRLAIGVGQLDLDRELDLAVGVEALSSVGLALAQRAGGGDRPLRELQVGDLGACARAA